MLDRLRRNIWNWLPAFLEVAETGSVVAASRRLGLTPAAVSRTLRLLQEELDRPLFNRAGRSLALNGHGHALREAVRAAMGRIDAGLSETLEDPFLGSLRVASLGVLTEELVVPSLIALKVAHPALVPEHLNLGAAEANALLVRGQLDLAFYYEGVTAEGVRIERLGETPTSIYCGRGHPLYGQRRPRRTQVLEHPFSVPQIGDTGRVMDGWPSEVDRRIGMRITLLRSNLEVCRSGALLTVLPDVTAAPYVARGELTRLPVLALPPIEIFAARASSAIDRSAVQRLVDDVRTRLRQANRQARAALQPGAKRPARAPARNRRARGTT